jgi:hypothetical protein
VQATGDAEIAKRLAELDSGEAKTISWAGVRKLNLGSCRMLADFTKFHEAAAAEYGAACEWSLERSPDAALQMRLLGSMPKYNALSRRSSRLRDVGQLGPAPIRRFLLGQFPFFLIYRERFPDGIEIASVAHFSRRPPYWKKGW